MKIIIPAFQNGELIPQKHTCDGENISPEIRIKEGPEGARSFVLIMDDPDSPTGTWLHWAVWNIGGNTERIEENKLPPGVVEGKNTFGSMKYGGPCPGSGEHRYFFRLYALDAMLYLQEGVSREELEESMEGHILEQAEYMGIYRRGGR